MSFDLDFSRDRQRLMASGACIAVVALAAGLNDTTSSAGLVAVALANLGSNVLATDISSRLAHRLGRSWQVSLDSALSQAVGQAIDLVIDQCAKSDNPRLADDRPFLKTLAKKAPARWEELAPIRADAECLAPLSEGSLVEFLAIGKEDDDLPSAIEPEVWSEVIFWMAGKEQIKLRPGSIYLVANELHRRLPSVLRKVLEQDFASNGQAYASLQMIVWGELLRSLADLKLDSANLRDDQQAALAAILETVSAATKHLGDRFHEGHRTLLTQLVDVAGDIKSHVSEGDGKILARLDHILAAMVTLPPPPVGDQSGVFGEPATVPPPSTAMAPSHNPRYLPRQDRDGDDVLVALHAKPKTARRVVLHGMPAVGKTESVREYAYRHSVEATDFREVYWTPAGSEEQLKDGLSGMARRMSLPIGRPVEEILGAITFHLEQNDGWLWVVEGVEDFAMISRYMPSPISGRVLITTTRPEAEFRGLGAIHVELTHFRDCDEGASFLLRLAGLMTDNQDLRRAHPDDVTAARSISDEVGGLPLALDQAAAYIDATSGSPSEYLDRYRCKGEELRKTRSLIGDREHLSVTLTFSLLLDRLEAHHPATADMLRLLAFYASGAIPEEILTAGSAALGDRLGPAIAEHLPETRMHAINNRILTYEFREGLFVFHVIIKHVLQDGLDGDDRRIWAERAVRAINLAVPEVNNLDMVVSNRMLRHLVECSRLINHYNFKFAESGRVLDKTGCYLFYSSRFSESLPLLDRALAITEAACGSDHPDTARTLNNKAVILQRRGDLTEADTLFLLALKIREDKLGTDNEVTAITLDNLGSLRTLQQRNEEAEELIRRALRIRQEKLGPHHTETAIGLANLGSLLASQRRFIEAEPFVREALAIQRAKLGTDHPWTAGNLNLLAAILTELNRQSEAELLLDECLSSGGARPGQDDVGRASILFEAAKLRMKRGRWPEAESLLRESLAILIGKLGTNHLNTAATMVELTSLLHHQESYREAEELARTALLATKHRLGTMDALTADRTARLAGILFTERKFGEAESLFLEAWKTFEKSLGKRHARSRQLRCDYVVTLKMNKRFTKFTSEMLKLDSKQAEEVENKLRSMGAL